MGCPGTGDNGGQYPANTKQVAKHIFSVFSKIWVADDQVTWLTWDIKSEENGCVAVRFACEGLQVLGPREHRQEIQVLNQQKAAAHTTKAGKNWPACKEMSESYWAGVISCVLRQANTQDMWDEGPRKVRPSLGLQGLRPIVTFLHARAKLFWNV